MFLNAISDVNTAKVIHRDMDRCLIQITTPPFLTGVANPFGEASPHTFNMNLSPLDNAVTLATDTIIVLANDNDIYSDDKIIGLIDFSVMGYYADRPDNQLQFVYITSMHVRCADSLESMFANFALFVRQRYSRVIGLCINVSPDYHVPVERSGFVMKSTTMLDNTGAFPEYEFSPKGITKVVHTNAYVDNIGCYQARSSDIYAGGVSKVPYCPYDMPDVLFKLCQRINSMIAKEYSGNLYNMLRLQNELTTLGRLLKSPGCRYCNMEFTPKSGKEKGATGIYSVYEDAGIIHVGFCSPMSASSAGLGVRRLLLGHALNDVKYGGQIEEVKKALKAWVDKGDSYVNNGNLIAKRTCRVVDSGCLEFQKFSRSCKRLNDKMIYYTFPETPDFYANSDLFLSGIIAFYTLVADIKSFK